MEEYKYLSAIFGKTIGKGLWSANIWWDNQPPIFRILLSFIFLFTIILGFSKIITCVIIFIIVSQRVFYMLEQQEKKKENDKIAF